MKQVSMFEGFYKSEHGNTDIPKALGNAVIHQDADTFMGTLPTGQVDLIFTDPPYGINYYSGHYIGENPFDEIENDDVEFDIVPLLNQSARVLVDGGALYLCCRWDNYLQWAPKIDGTGLTLRNVIIWVKNNWTAGDLEGNFGYQYEMILFITKGRHKLRGYRYSNVWTFDRVPPERLVHPTQKPTKLIMRAIKASTDLWAWVVDPYCGSGSSGLACQETDRVFTLCDISERYVDLSKERLGV